MHSWKSLISLRDIYSNKLQTQHIDKVEMNIIRTIYKLEMIFPPSFFDSMEHLPIHLPFEAKAGGLVHYRWMYPFERLDITLQCNSYIKVFSMFFLIENTWLIQCRYLFNLNKRLRTRRMLRLRYVRPILLRRSQHLSRTISNLIWDRETIAVHNMMMAVKCLPVGTCQYSPILDDPHLKMS